MAVYAGNADAARFASPSVPFQTGPNASGLWNWLFINNDTTVTAISGTAIDGTPDNSP